MKRIKVIALALITMLPALTATAQKYGKTPEDSLNCVTNIFLYTESYKNKQYLDAYTPWKEVLKSCPASSKNIYIRGVVILKSRYNATKVVEERNAIVDELMNLYDMRILYYGEAAKVTAMKASDMEALKGNTGLKEYYPLYAEAMRLGATELEPAMIDKFFAATIRYVTAGNADTTLIVDNYDLATDALDKMLAAAKDSATQNAIYTMTGNVEARFSPFATCEELVNIYTKKFKANPEDVDLLKKITNILRKKGCMKTDLFFQATEKLHSLEPSPNTAYLMGQMCYNKDKFSQAVDYLNEALKSAEDAEDIYKMNILLGLSYAGANSYSAARNAYRRAADANPNKGEPYRLIAQLYAGSTRSIDDGLGGKTAYWAAVDMARRAINVDSSPENVEAAQRLINSYSGHFPKQDDAFMMDLIDGAGYTVKGWIGESTVVRTRK